jgi:hypothetical protein
MEYRVTPEMLEASIVREDYIKLGTKMTACVLTLQNGHEVVGIAGVVDPTKYDINIGSKFAREKAIEQLWPLFGYAMQIKMYEDTNHIIEDEIVIDEDTTKHRIKNPVMHKSSYIPGN